MQEGVSLLPWASLNALVLEMGRLPPGKQPLLEIIHSAARLLGPRFLLEPSGSPGQATVLPVRPTLRGCSFILSPPISPPRASAPQSPIAPPYVYPWI